MGQRNSSLDTLRGVAILMVVAGHYLPDNLVFGETAWHVTSLGRGGVILFFLLSGYLIFWNAETQSTAVFVSRRAFKILPAYLISVLALFALGYLVEPRWSVTALFANLTMSQDIARQPLFNGVYWTLLIEVKFYALIAAQYFFFRDRWTVAIPLAMIAVNLLILLTRGHASLLLTYLPAFYVGIQIRRAQRDGASGRGVLIVSLGVAGSFVLFDPFYPWWACFYLLAATVALIYAARDGFSNGVLSFFGQTSYSQYLYHSIVGALVFSAVGPVSGYLQGALAVTLAASISTILSVASYRMVELPFVKFGKLNERFWLSMRSQQA